jgi:hypothetical protein
MESGLAGILIALMSEEHINLVRGVIEASERGEMGTVFAAYDPEIESASRKEHP